MENKSLRILDKKAENKVRGRASLLAVAITLAYVLACVMLITVIYGPETLQGTGYIMGVLLAGSAMLLMVVTQGKIMAAQGAALVLMMAADAEPGEEGLPREIEERFKPGSLLWRALKSRRH